ncbi:LADA_0G08834g1_1 [Lachancea dasiensis]|uniref:LADA_0G08834g1_1 n=1 Tax=Lachancea dasiensis TaxID=1072105 RepID=A0A1G4JU67_9SACH|nr:LADA_0G08834g1_1 [Lachancea dasiensis]
MKKIPVAIVTGATRGIGRSIVDKLSSEGVCCIMVGSKLESFQHMHNNPVQLKGQMHWNRGIAIDLSEWPKWTQQTTYPGWHFSESPGRRSQPQPGSWALLDFDYTLYDLALMVNCAGVTQASPSILYGTDAMQRLMNINFLSAASLCNIASKRMARSRRYLEYAPHIINISSVVASPTVTPVPGTSLYAGSKAALSQYSRVLSAELARAGIRVSCVSPSLVAETDMIRNLPAKAKSVLESYFGAEHRQSPDDVASQVWDLYTSASS